MIFMDYIYHSPKSCITVQPGSASLRTSAQFSFHFSTTSGIALIANVCARLDSYRPISEQKEGLLPGFVQVSFSRGVPALPIGYGRSNSFKVQLSSRLPGSIRCSMERGQTICTNEMKYESLVVPGQYKVAYNGNTQVRYKYLKIIAYLSTVL